MHKRSPSLVWSVLAALWISLPTQATEVKEAMTLEDLRKAIVNFGKGSEPGQFSLDLSGYTFHWELDPGGGLRYVLVSCNHHGLLLAFAEDGALRQTVETAEITSFGLCDVDGDGKSELITEETDGWGTGMVEKRFHVYQLQGDLIRELWDGVSYAFYPSETSPEGFSYSTALGSIRCGPEGVHYRLEEEDENGQQCVLERVLRLEGGTIRAEPDRVEDSAPN